MPRRSPPQTADTGAKLPPPDSSRQVSGPGSWSLRRIGPLWLLLAIAVVHGASHIDTGVDTWTSLAAGRHILAHGVTPAEPFSFNSRQGDTATGAGPVARAAAWLHPNGWINQNWLTHIVFAATAEAFGLDALVVLKYLAYALTAALLLLNARERRAEPVLAIVLVAFALLAGRTFFEIRAQDATNLLASALMLILTVTALRAPRAAWLLVPLFAVWGNTHGGFVWGLVAAATFLAASTLAARIGGSFVALAPGALRGLVLAGAGALVAVVALSPSRLANLTHPLAISVGPDAREWRSVLEWRPLAQGSAGERTTFVLLAVVAVVAAIGSLRRSGRGRPSRGGDPDRSGPAGRQPFDLGAAAVLLLTGAMAVTSRRFVPMVYLLAAPLLAQWLTDAGGRFAADRPLFRRLREAARARGAVARVVMPLLWVLAAAATASYARAYSRSFFGPWPLDVHRVSLADRALQTVGQPWETCQFVTLNRLHGRMWTFWENGGFWAGCQPPDAATGEVAVKIFIDGRAQQAYDAAVHRSYNLIDAGGPVGLGLERAGREAGADELAAIRAWVARRLTEDEIWLAHVATRNQHARVAGALLSLPSWQIVYLDEVHILLADTATVQGAALAARVDSGAAEFPSQLSRLLTLAHRAQRYGGAGGLRRAVDLVLQADAIQPTQRAIAIATASAQDPSCLADVLALCRNMVTEAINNRVELAQRHGNHQRLTATAAAAYFLQQEAMSRDDGDAARSAAEQLRWLTQEANALLPATEW